VVNNQSPYDLTIIESPETLWENFEKTGSVKDYLRFVQKAEKPEDPEPAQLPS